METKTFQYLNLDYLSLMTDGDVDMTITMLDILFEELPQEVELLTVHYAAAKWDDLKSVSHKLKSTLAFVGNDQMTTANNQIEYNAMHEVDLDIVPSLIAKVNGLLPHVIKELQEYYSSLK